MNWRLLFTLAPLGPVMGALTVLGVFPEGTDRFAWIAIVGASAVWVARREPERALLHGAVSGFWNGASSTLIQALFLQTLVANNPGFMEKFANQPEGFDLDYFVFMLVPFIGIAGAAMTGFASMMAARAFAARKRRDGETPP